ncbi:ribonuclease H1-like [Belonocnema kinseyi]|uniref:ribonuclease H1-like n=1 Tax=Belonocnema kinseyi TaxID=2817044 RepID=UPI00143CD05E|nr:ribonuclease H1-like [Belonocnema kinseyi]
MPEDDQPPQSAPATALNPCFPSLCDKTTDVYVDGACIYNKAGEREGGIGVWFGYDHPWNVSQPATGRQMNNAAEIQAATIAARKASENGISKLRINTDSKFLIDSCDKWIPYWKANGWKTNNGKPVVNQTEFEELRKALEGLDVTWNHVPGHQGIESNEMADYLAQMGINRSNAAQDSERIPLKAIQERAEIQRSVNKFDRSLEDHQSYFWGKEELDEVHQDETFQTERTALTEGENEQELLNALKNMDLCTDIDDPPSARANAFLESFRGHLEVKDDSKPKDHIALGAEILPGTKNSGADKRSTIRFKNSPEIIESPIMDTQPSMRS